MYFAAPKADSPVTAVLVGIEGELLGKLYALTNGENKLGRAETCEIVLMSPTISREHANIVHQDGVFAIIPLSDKNRTYLNDEVVEGCELSDGDKLRMGRTTFRFRTIEGP
jgi:pSer/pThr/pTyr-binding forkhead associated (FHA) protein